MNPLPPFFRTNKLPALALMLGLACTVAPVARGVEPARRRAVQHAIVVGYVTASSLYEEQPFYVKKLAASGSAERLDQINYSAGAVTKGRCSLSDPLADVLAPFPAENSVDGVSDNPTAGMHGYFHQLDELKRRYPRLKILISLEGRASDFAQDAKPENRTAFVASCVDVFVRGRFMDGMTKPGLFDGFDIDWESPHQEDAANFKALIEEFRKQMDAVRPGLRLSVAVDQAPERLPGTDFAALAPIVDEFAVMNYDYAGPWSRETGFLAPLFSTSTVEAHSGSIERSIARYKAAGVPAGKLLMGLPFYGYGWTDVNGKSNGLFQTGQPVRGDQPYRLIRGLAAPAQVFRDPLSQAPWIFDGKTFWTYEDTISVRYKVSYAMSQGLGGIMIWELSGDTADAELLRTAYQALHHPLKAAMFARKVTMPTEVTQAKGQ